MYVSNIYHTSLHRITQIRTIHVSALAIIAGLFFSISLLTPQVWFLSFFFAIPLFHVLSVTTSPCLHGYLFGICTIDILLFDAITTVGRLSHDNAYYIRYGLPAVALILLPAYPACFFFINSYIKKYFSINSLFLQSAVIMSYILFIDKYMFLILDIQEGCSLLHPALAYMHHDIGKNIIIQCGSFGAASLSIIIAQLIYYFSIKSIRKTIVICFSIAAGIILRFSYTHQCEVPTWHTDIVYAPIRCISHDKEYVINMIKKIVHSHSTYCTIFPESSCIYDFSQISTEQSQHYFGNKSIIIGSMRYHNNQKFNTLFHVRNNIFVSYDKQHAMPFIERLPRLFNFTPFMHAFFHKGLPITPSINSRPILNLTDNLQVQPYICSELFTSQAYPSHSVPILAICNDYWFSSNHTRNLMGLLAQIKSIDWQLPIIYVSFYHAFIAMPSGKLYPIRSTLF